MTLSQLCRIAKSPSDYISGIKAVIEAHHFEISNWSRKPQYFTVVVDEFDRINIVPKLLHIDPEGYTRLFACKRLPEEVFTSSHFLYSDSIEKNIYSFVHLNGSMLAIQAPFEKLPLFINETVGEVSKLVKSRLTKPEMWEDLRPLYIAHDEYPIAKLRYTGKPVDMYLSPLSLMNYILGLDSYREPHGYLYPNQGLVPHNKIGFYTEFSPL